MTGSPWSPGPPTALSRTRGGVPSRLSLRTWTPKRTSGPPPARRIAQARNQTTSRSRPASSWQATPRGTATPRSQKARIRARYNRGRPARREHPKRVSAQAGEPCRTCALVSGGCAAGGEEGISEPISQTFTPEFGKGDSCGFSGKMPRKTLTKQFPHL
jgi:hypothetical protein